MTELLQALASGRRPRPRALVAPLLVIALLCLVGISVGALARGELREPRTITLVARDLDFFLSGGTTASPRLVVERGEEIRLVLRNEDAGMEHDLTLPSLGAATQRLAKAGTMAEITLRVPDYPGEHDYLCSLHPQLMRGILEVR